MSKYYDRKIIMKIFGKLTQKRSVVFAFGYNSYGEKQNI